MLTLHLRMRFIVWIQHREASEHLYNSNIQTAMLEMSSQRIYSSWVSGAESGPDRLALSEYTTCPHFPRLNLIGLVHHLSRTLF